MIKPILELSKESTHYNLLHLFTWLTSLSLFLHLYFLLCNNNSISYLFWDFLVTTNYLSLHLHHNAAFISYPFTKGFTKQLLIPSYNPLFNIAIKDDGLFQSLISPSLEKLIKLLGKTFCKDLYWEDLLFVEIISCELLYSTDCLIL